jgi:hypothetical protein
LGKDECEMMIILIFIVVFIVGLAIYINNACDRIDAEIEAKKRDYYNWRELE